jgi:hypothetical protein
MEQKRMMKSCTHPAKTAAISHSVPGKYPNCAARVGPTSGPGPAMAAAMAKQNPFIGGHEIAAIVVTLRGSCARIIQRQQTCRDEGGIKR